MLQGLFEMCAVFFSAEDFESIACNPEELVEGEVEFPDSNLSQMKSMFRVRNF